MSSFQSQGALPLGSASGEGYSDWDSDSIVETSPSESVTGYSPPAAARVVDNLFTFILVA